jgi:hypothetical protein
VRSIKVWVKNAIRPLLAIAVVVPAQVTYGGSVGFGLFDPHRHAWPQLSEPAALTFLGIAMLIFAKSARRQASFEVPHK